MTTDTKAQLLIVPWKNQRPGDETNQPAERVPQYDSLATSHPRVIETVKLFISSPFPPLLRRGYFHLQRRKSQLPVNVRGPAGKFFGAGRNKVSSGTLRNN